MRSIVDTIYFINLEHPTYFSRSQGSARSMNFEPAKSRQISTFRDIQFTRKRGKPGHTRTRLARGLTSPP